MHHLQSISLQDIQNGNFRSLARAISHVENGIGNYFDLLKDMPASSTPVIGITGPPGAGKSTLVDALIGQLLKEGKRIAVLCVDPSSSFYFGALLGDRIRMSDWYNHPKVFIRSLATRGSLGGLHPRIIEIADLLKMAAFDYIIIETVGVGQNEIEIAGLADTTVVVLVPEGGDDIQSMKAGLLEIADIFVVNKSDRPDADLFIRNLRSVRIPTHQGEGHETPILKTIASQKQGISELTHSILTHLESNPGKKFALLAEQAWLLIQYRKMQSINKKDLAKKIEEMAGKKDFNLYRFIEDWI